MVNQTNQNSFETYLDRLVTLIDQALVELVNEDTSQYLTREDIEKWLREHLGILYLGKPNIN